MTSINNRLIGGIAKKGQEYEGDEFGEEEEDDEEDDDEEAVEKQLTAIKAEVMELKDHPALLIWGIGNELNLHYTNPKVWDAVNDISKMIHSVDGNHPTTTSLAGISKKEIDYIKDRCSDLDILPIQMYGDLPSLPEMVKKSGWNGPYMITEWGATGHWAVPKTQRNAPIEENSWLLRYNFSFGKAEQMFLVMLVR